MKIKLNRVNDAFHLQDIVNENVKVDLDANEEIGGVNAGVRPMSLLLYAVGSCSAMDVISILKKQKQEIESLEIEVQGEREKVDHAMPFKKIHVLFKFKGNLDAEKVDKALDLSFTKYCSVSKMLEKSVKIKYTFEIEV